MELEQATVDPSIVTIHLVLVHIILSITMPSAYPLLPADAPSPYVKPTLDNTNGGKTYKPTHPELFRVEFTSNIDGQEGFSSRLVAKRVGHKYLINVTRAHIPGIRQGGTDLRSRECIVSRREGLLVCPIRNGPARPPRAQLGSLVQ